jgi:Rrf2 family protein
LKHLSKRCKYGLRALYCLTRNHSDEHLAVSDIAEREHIPRKFLEAILVHLRKAGIVASQIGSRGGYRLAKSPGEITIGSVVRIIDGPVAPSPCASETKFKICPDCVDRDRCETQVVMKRVRDAMASVLDNITLAQACREIDEQGAIHFDI